VKIFLDTADIEAIKRANDTGLLDGVTTNPTLIAKTGKTFHRIVEEICNVLSGPVSAEVVAETAADMLKEACEISQVAPNVVVKIPMTVEGMKAVKTLEKEKGIHVNVTMIFSTTQAHLAAKAGASYISIVLSRLDAVCNESSILVEDTMRMLANYDYKAEVIAGSLKTQNHILSCLRAGVDIATVPENLFFQMFQHPLTDSGLADFKRDWARVVMK
jgi:transaldolase